MKRMAISMSVVVLSLAASAALAANFTERMRTDRMTITKVDPDGGRFFCAEHRRWTHVSKPDATMLAVGDIVSVDARAGEVTKVRVVRTAADELSSPE